MNQLDKLTTRLSLASRSADVVVALIWYARTSGRAVGVKVL